MSDSPKKKPEFVTLQQTLDRLMGKDRLNQVRRALGGDYTQISKTFGIESSKLYRQQLELPRRLDALGLARGRELRSPSFKRMCDQVDILSKKTGLASLKGFTFPAALAPPPVNNGLEDLRKAMARRRDAEEKAAEQRSRQLAFTSLVQTRAILHDAAKMREVVAPGTYTAVAPAIVSAAWKLPIDQIDKDVDQHAEAFVRTFVSGTEKLS